jgi:hypothetical protein
MNGLIYLVGLVVVVLAVALNRGRIPAKAPTDCRYLAWKFLPSASKTLFLTFLSMPAQESSAFRRHPCRNKAAELRGARSFRKWTTSPASFFR